MRLPYAAAAVAAFGSARPQVTRAIFFLGGAALTLAFAPFGAWFLAPLLAVPPLLAAFCFTPRRAAGAGFAFGAGLFLAGTYWIYISIHVFGQAPLILAITLMLALVLIMAAWYAGLGWLAARLVAGDSRRLLLLAPAAWVTVEWLRGWVLSGFPWLALGYSQVDSPLGGWLPVAGVYGTSYLVVLSAAGFVAAFGTRWRAAAVTVAVLPWLAGALVGTVRWTERAGEPLTVTVVQGGVSQDRKWLAEQFQPTLRLYRDGLLAAGSSDIVVWPEVAIPSLVHRVEPYLDLLQRDLAAAGQTLLLGILEGDGEDVYNSVLLLDGASRQVYRKRHLVPFGEYFPVPDFVREWLRLMSLPNNDLSAGASRQPLLETHTGHGIAVAICYEDAYGNEQLYALPAADILVNVSNDAWFGDSIAPHQHLEIARARAREAGRYVVRATNNGISALIGPAGRLVEIAPQFEYASMTFEVAPMAGATPYARTGNWPVVTAMLMLVGGGLARIRHRARR